MKSLYRFLLVVGMLLGFGTDIFAEQPVEKRNTPAATIVVAAHNSRNKEKADYICDGRNDEKIIYQGISALFRNIDDEPFVAGPFAIWDRMDVVGSWKLSSGAQTVSSDDKDKQEGAASLKVVGGTASSPGIERSGLSLDWSGYDTIEFWAKIPATAMPQNQISLEIYNSKGDRLYYSKTLKADEWEHIKFDLNSPKYIFGYKLRGASEIRKNIVKIRIFPGTRKDNYAFRVDTIALSRWTKLASPFIQGRGERVTGAKTTYRKETDYEMDYVNGKIRVLPSGRMKSNNTYHISYKWGGGEVRLLEGTYTLRNKLSFVYMVGVTISGNGDNTIVKSKDQARTVLTRAVSAKDIFLQVKDANAFVVGEEVEINDKAGTSEYMGVRKIDGNEITLSRPLKNSYPKGSFLFSSWSAICLARCSYVTIKDLCLDGNVSNWPLEASYCGSQYVYRDNVGDHNIVSNCMVVNGKRVGIAVRNAKHDIVSNCKVVDMEGDGILYESDCLGSIITGNVVENCGNGCLCENSRNASVIGNSFINCGSGIKLTSTKCYNMLIESNTCQGCGISIYNSVYSLIQNNICEGNSGYGLRLIGNSTDNSITGNLIRRNYSYGFYIGDNCSKNIIGGNIISENSYAGLLLNGDNSLNSIVGNTICNNKRHGIWISKPTSVNNIIKDNILIDNGSGAILNKGTGTQIYRQHCDSFMNCLSSLPAYCGSWKGTGKKRKIASSITNPDMPRNLSVTCINKFSSSGNVVIEGIDACGNPVSETFILSPGKTIHGNKAFSTISKIAIPGTVLQSDTISVGIGNKLGLSNVIYETTDAYKMKKNNADIAIGKVDTINGTIDPGGIEKDDSFAVYYRSNLNVITCK